MKGKTEEREESFGCAVIVTTEATPATKCARRVINSARSSCRGGRRLFAGHEVEVRVPLSLAARPSLVSNEWADGLADGRKDGSEEEKPSSTCGRRENPMNETIGPPSSYVRTATEIPALGGAGVSV